MTIFYKSPIGYLKIELVENIKQEFKIVSCVFVDEKNENIIKKEDKKLEQNINKEAQKKDEKISLETQKEIQTEIFVELDNYFLHKKDFSKEFLKKYINMSELLNADGKKATDFQKDIWGVINKVKIGQVINYTEMSERARRPEATRAAGSACGQNPLALFIPCHRVLRKDGEVNYKDRGYSWGPERKTWLLEHEGHVFKKL